MSESVPNATMIPYYCGVEGEEKDGLNCGTENCWAINAKASEADQQATMDFLVWCVTDPDASRKLVDSFGIMPYKSAAESTNGFLQDAARYTADGCYVMDWATNYQPNVDDYRATLVSALNQYNSGRSDRSAPACLYQKEGGAAVMNKEATLAAERRRKTTLSVVLTVICIIYVLPVLTVVINSFKQNTFVKTETFALPTAESAAGFSNFIKGMTFGNYPFWKSALYSVVITVLSTALILLFTSMAAWYIARVNSIFCKIVYYLCVFSMVVPFRMVMFTLSKTADKLRVWNDYLLPVLVLDINEYRTIPIHIQYLKEATVRWIWVRQWH